MRKKKIRKSDQVKDRRLTPKQIDRLLANQKPITITQNTDPVIQNVISEQASHQSLVFTNNEKDYDTLDSVRQIKTFCSFVKDVITRYEENERQQSEAETMEMDIKHCMELVPKLTEKQKKALYNKLTDVLQLRRACKSENEILLPLYNYFKDKVMLNKLTQLQGSVSTSKEIVSNRAYSCRTSVLDDFSAE